MSCMLKCDFCRKTEKETELYEYVDENIKNTYLKNYRVKQPIEHLCIDCINFLNSIFVDNILCIRNDNVMLTEFGKKNNK